MLWMLVRSFPVEVTVDNILSHLDPISLVRLDRAWPPQHRRELRQAWFSLLPAIDLPNTHQVHTAPAVYQPLLTICLSIKLIFLSGDHPRHLHVLRENCTKIQALKVRCDSIADVSLLNELADDSILCFKVTEVTFRLQYISVWEHLGNFPELNYLAVAINDAKDALSASQLTPLNLNICKLMVWEVEELETSALSLVLNCLCGCPLTSLSVRGNGVTDKFLALIAQRYPNLEQLIQWNCSQSTELTVSGLQTFVQSCRKLQYIRIRSHTPTYSAVICTAMQCCSYLCTVDINGAGIDDAVMEAMAGNRPPLVELRGQWGVTSLVALKQAASVLQQLQHVHLSFEVTAIEAMVETLAAAFSYCGRLRSIFLMPKAVKMDNILTAIAARCGHLKRVTVTPSSLEPAELESCGVHLVQIAQANSRTLEDVDIDGALLSREQVVSMASHLRFIESLAIFRKEGFLLDDEVLCAVAESCPKLRYIEPISPHITDKAVLALAKHCRCLHHLSLQHCALVTEDALMQLLQSTRVDISAALPKTLSREARERIETACQRHRQSCEHSDRA